MFVNLISSYKKLHCVLLGYNFQKYKKWVTKGAG